MRRETKDPRTKEELLNKLLSYDFNGDVRTLGEGTQIKRVDPQTLHVTFPKIGRTYEIAVRIPREASEDEVTWDVAPTAKPKRNPGRKQ